MTTKRPTKALLIEGTIKLLTTGSPKATSMEDISGTAGIRPSAVYKHFRNKEDIIKAAISKAFQDAVPGLDHEKINTCAKIIINCKLAPETQKQINAEQKNMTSGENKIDGNYAKIKIKKAIENILWE